VLNQMVRRVRGRIDVRSLDSTVYEAAIRPVSQFGGDGNDAGRLD
jgi:hypothetical protein